MTGFENGTYKYKSKTVECSCELQMQLRKHYLLANIGDQYQRLDWNDFVGNDDVKNVVNTYIDRWNQFKLNGMGVEFTSPRLGVGKTFGATHIGKELVKRGERVYFIPFLSVISTMTRSAPDWEYTEERLHTSTVLILDEVTPPNTVPQHGLFADKFEELIRNRTNFNQVTIMTTNLTEEKLFETYPRPYSLLQAKQVRIELKGDDARRGMIAERNLELVLNGEVPPIT